VHKAVGEEDKVPGVFELLVKCLRALDKNGYSGDLFVSYFEMNLMGILGYSLTVDKCRKCGKLLSDSWSKYFFSIDNGSIECEKCTNFGITVSKGAALSFDPILKGNIDKNMHKYVSEIDKLLKVYIGRKLESRFKSLEIEAE
jgi:DNA repair protein RecO